jgi:hypothetical protein
MQYSYSAILSSIQNYCTDNSTDFTTEYPTLIQVAQDRVLKDLNITSFDTSTTTTSATAFITRPNGMIALRSLFVLVNNARQLLSQRTKSYIDCYWANSGSVATPRYFADCSTTQWQIAPVPDQSYTFQINYTTRLAYLTSGTPTNWLSNTYGEVLFDAAMILAKKFFREDPVSEGGEMRDWEARYASDLALAKRELMEIQQGSELLMTPIVQIVGASS